VHCSRHAPAIRYRPPAATFLAWLDCRTLALPAILDAAIARMASV
jgi:bifunctional pyridoxal-dependent enzyme with beta-cystathionase and maltose regulon repressor activities